jgi:hypothetical protein
MQFLAMPMNIQISDVGHVIQLAIAPVFLLTGVGTKLAVLTSRLARIIDRTRVLDERLRDGLNEAYSAERETLYIRAHLVNTAITSSTACGLMVCLVIALLFLGDTTNLPLDQFIAGLFVLAMLSLISSFGFFLREIFISSRFMREQHRLSLKQIR